MPPGLSFGERGYRERRVQLSTIVEQAKKTRRPLGYRLTFGLLSSDIDIVRPVMGAFYDLQIRYLVAAAIFSSTGSHICCSFSTKARVSAGGIARE